MSSPDSIALVWLRRDLRLHDNPALSAACERHRQVIPVYLHVPGEESPWAPGAAGTWWLRGALGSLATELAAAGCPLVVRAGETRATLATLVERTGATALYWNRLYDPAVTERDEAIRAWAGETGLEVESFHGALLHEPWTIANRSGAPYRVFTPFWKCCLDLGMPREPLPAPELPPHTFADLAQVEDLALLPDLARQGNWDRGLAEAWRPTESAGLDLLAGFADGPVEAYPDRRDLPGEPGTSRLSPYLHFGQLSPYQVHQACVSRGRSAGPYLRQLYWREFGHHLLYHFPHTDLEPLDPRFRHFPWRADYDEDLRHWQRGRTGIPIIDAGMRELWRTGWMHNRVRMLVASLLSKNLRIPWQEGARWFWDTLVDADLANNTMGWQWTAGSGADAAPYFRIFNPSTQGERSDPKGRYVRRWLPELAGLPDKWIHRPWEAPAQVLAEAGVRLGDDYPAPLVDLRESRQAALDAWDSLKTIPRDG
jgi:deoxyribodipyrimidine photo-lyase